MREHEEDIDECIHSINKCDKCSYQSKQMRYVQNPSEDVEEQQSHPIKCNHCEKVLKDNTDLKSHISTHRSYKPCTKYQTDSCNTLPCRFNHTKLNAGQEICFKCGDKFSSKTDIINHIKTQHGNTICHKFLQNKCGRNNMECIFSHKTAPTVNVQRPKINHMQGFPQIHQTPLHSPPPQMPNMSQHLQNQQSVPGAHQIPQVDILKMLPQIISQVVTAITLQITEHNKQT